VVLRPLAGGIVNRLLEEHGGACRHCSGRGFLLRDSSE
jgi:hypothetical protein